MITVIRPYIKPDVPRHLTRQINKHLLDTRAHEVELRQIKEPTEFSRRTLDLQDRLSRGSPIHQLLPDAYALVCEVARRILWEWPRENQLMAAIAMHYGFVVALPNGEGKTLAATMPLYLNALYGHPVHLITSNEYLAKRDATWMGPIYHTLGLSVSAILSKDEAYMSVEDNNQFRMDLCSLERAYRSNIIYLTLDEAIYGYLRDQLALPPLMPVQGNLGYALFDEADINLLDRALQPLSIASRLPSPPDNYYWILWRIAQSLTKDIDYEIHDDGVFFLEKGLRTLEQYSNRVFSSPGILQGIQQAILAKDVYHRGIDYIVVERKIRIIDSVTHFLKPEYIKFTGVVQQALETKERLNISSESYSVGEITVPSFTQLYTQIAGMSGTAKDNEQELYSLYGLKIFPVPSYADYLCTIPQKELIKKQQEDKQGVFSIYVRPSDLNHVIYYERRDFKDLVLRSPEKQLREVTIRVLKAFCAGRPVLVGASTDEISERISHRLNSEMLLKLATVSVIKEIWCQKNNIEQDGRLIQELLPLEAPLEILSVTNLQSICDHFTFR